MRDTYEYLRKRHENHSKTSVFIDNFASIKTNKDILTYVYK